jgi:hypothetical protein
LTDDHFRAAVCRLGAHSTIPMAALATTTLGDGCDHETLADVLAFLDAFDGVGEAEVRSVGSPQPTRSTSAVCGTSATCSERRQPSKASAKNLARVARYWRHKDELQSLRSTAEYLSNVLEAKKRGSLTLRSLHASPRSAAKQLSKSTGMNWEERARVERELRRRAEETNVRLRRLAGKQMKWSNMLDTTLRKAWWSTWQVRRTLQSTQQIASQLTKIIACLLCNVLCRSTFRARSKLAVYPGSKSSLAGRACARRGRLQRLLQALGLPRSRFQRGTRSTSVVYGGPLCRSYRC